MQVATGVRGFPLPYTITQQVSWYRRATPGSSATSQNIGRGFIQCPAGRHYREADNGGGLRNDMKLPILPYPTAESQQTRLKGQSGVTNISGGPFSCHVE